MNTFAALGIFSILCALVIVYGLLIAAWHGLVSLHRGIRARIAVAGRSPSIPAAPSPLPPLPRRIARNAYPVATPHTQAPTEPTDHDIFLVIAEATNACRNHANHDRKGEKR